MNRLVRLARFESIYESSRRPIREKFHAMFVEHGFSEEEFESWASVREWSS